MPQQIDLQNEIQQAIRNLVDIVPMDRKVSKQEMINRYYNIHLHQYLAAELNIMLFSKKDQNEKIGQIPRVIAPGMAPVLKEIFVKDELAHWEKVAKENQEILENITKLENA